VLPPLALVRATHIRRRLALLEDAKGMPKQKLLPLLEDVKGMPTQMRPRLLLLRLRPLRFLPPQLAKVLLRLSLAARRSTTNSNI
jgi:hypothetical protein